MAVIREATRSDVDQVSRLFVRAYGEDYPFPGFYDTEWLTKSVYDDATLFLVAEEAGDIIATGSIMLAAGGLSDLVGEMGRLVAEPSKRARGGAAELVAALIERTRERIQFHMAEVRTVHKGSQRLAEEFGWTACGFEPLKYQFTRRESVVFYGRPQGLAFELRRNNPRVIPEAATLAQTVLKQMDLPVDAIVEDEPDGYPTNPSGFELERLQQTGVSSLLRIERGRVSQREIFGNLALAHGFFNMSDTNSHYLVARDGDAVLGAVGYTYDPIDRKVRIFELIEFDDAVKGYLLAAVDRIAREELHVDYQEVDLSAYSPKIQRTFERLGFVPVAYCPSMVFEQVERLDVIRMAKVSCQYDLGRMRILPAGQRLREIVEREMEDRLIGMEITEGARRVDLFHNLPEGDLHHLARIGALHEYEAGTVLVREGEAADRLFILVEGAAEARSGEQVFGRLEAGNIFGEMALVERGPRSADVVLTSTARLIEIELPRLERLMEARPRLGYLVARNLARGLSMKLRRR
jgi:N-acetylglutamate synthase-like GNAT family acetyltransferase